MSAGGQDAMASPGRWEDILQRSIIGDVADIPFVATLKLPPLGGWTRGEIWMEWTVDAAVFHPRGAVFGGYLAAIADRALGLTAMTVLEEDEGFTTTDLSVAFFRPISGGTLRIEGRVIHRGRSFIQAEAEFVRDDGKLAAKASASQAIIAFQQSKTVSDQEQSFDV